AGLPCDLPKEEPRERTGWRHQPVLNVVDSPERSAKLPRARALPPRVTERILHSAHPVAVQLIGYRSLRLCASGDRLLENRVHVLHVQVDRHGRPAYGLGAARAYFRKLVGKHDDPITNPDL